MAQRVTNEQKRIARTADLQQFLLTYYPDTVRRKGSQLIHTEHDSLSIGPKGQWQRFSTNESGNAIDYLCKFLNYDFISAVAMLAPDSSNVSVCTPSTPSTPSEPTQPQPQLLTPPASVQSPPPKPFKLPEKTGNTRQMYAYLIQRRGFTPKFVQWLIEQDLAYQEKSHNNIVWINKTKTYAELCGTTGIRFKSIISGSQSGEYWCFSVSDTPKYLYICESVIDACSLYLIQDQLMSKQGKVLENECPAIYCSLGGLKSSILEKILSDFPNIPKVNVVLAIDNDPPADIFAAKYPDIRRLIPDKEKGWKDWNDRLKTAAKIT